MGIIERLKDFLNPKTDNANREDLNKEDIHKEIYKITYGDDPYYILWGHNLTSPPPLEDLYKYWIYNHKFMKKSEWEKLGFEIKKVELKKVGPHEENLSYRFNLISNYLAEDWKKEKKDRLNIYEQIQQEKESNKITSENTIYWINHHSENILESLDYTPATLDINDIKVTFNDIIENLNYLKDYEHCENFFEFSDLKEKPSLIYDELIKSFESYLIKIITNAKDYVIEKTSKMKTKEGKKNTLNRFLDRLIESKTEFTKEELIQRYNLIVNEVKDLLNI